MYFVERFNCIFKFQKIFLKMFNKEVILYIQIFLIFIFEYFKNKVVGKIQYHYDEKN